MCSGYPRNTDRQVKDDRASKRVVWNRQLGRVGWIEVVDPVGDLDREQIADRALDRPQSDALDGIETPLGGHNQELGRLGGGVRLGDERAAPLLERRGASRGR